MINMLRTLIEKVDNVQEQIVNKSKNLGTLRKNQKWVLKVKNTVTEMKDAFEGLTCRLGMTTAKVSGLENMSSETSPNEIQTKKKKEWKKERTDYQKTDTISNVVIYI